MTNVLTAKTDEVIEQKDEFTKIELEAVTTVFRY